MTKFIHRLHIEDESGNEIIALIYSGELPYPPSVGLIIQISSFAYFEVQKKVLFSIPNQQYETMSVVIGNQLDLKGKIARYLKNGFEIWDQNELSDTDVDELIKFSKLKGLIG